MAIIGKMKDVAIIGKFTLPWFAPNTHCTMVGVVIKGAYSAIYGEDTCTPVQYAHCTVQYTYCTLTHMHTSIVLESCH